jgi:uncharacterized protein YjiS (DUF1127 family)
MHAPNKLDVSQTDYRSPSQEQRQVWASTRNAIRDLAIHVVAALVRCWQAHADRRDRLRAIAQLEALSERELKDIGVHRSGIYWMINHVPPASISPGLAAESDFRHAACGMAAVKERSRAA